MNYEILKQTDEIRVETEEEAKALIEDFKNKAAQGGYEIIKYTSTLKEKKSKGEVVSSYIIVSITKRWQ